MYEQEFYKEKAAWKALREERFLAMADKEQEEGPIETREQQGPNLHGSLTSILSRDHKRHPSISPGWMHHQRESWKLTLSKPQIARFVREPYPCIVSAPRSKRKATAVQTLSSFLGIWHPSRRACLQAKKWKPPWHDSINTGS